MISVARYTERLHDVPMATTESHHQRAFYKFEDGLRLCEDMTFLKLVKMPLKTLPLFFTDAQTVFKFTAFPGGFLSQRTVKSNEKSDFFKR
jgi:hypothetical protein